MQLFHDKIPATLETISLTRRALRRALSEVRLSEEVIDDLQLLWSEIAVNAVTHSDPGPREIECRILIRGAQIGIEISDDGVPFSDFEKHFRAENNGLDQLEALNPMAPTSGRGVHLVRGLTDSFTYQPGPPNRFTLWRRLAKRQPVILIAEDERVLAESYALGLHPTYRSVIVESVEDALARLAQTPIDLVLADYHLVDGTGRNLAEAMERMADRLPVPLILITGDRNPDLEREMLELGFEAALQKPVSAAKLADHIALALRRTERRRASHFRHFGVAAAQLLTSAVPAELPAHALRHHSKVADLGSGDAVLHLKGATRERIVLIDVMGHGLGAHAGAIAFAAIVRALHAEAGEGGPAHLLGMISHALYSDQALGRLIATLLVVDCLHDGRMEIAAAGHPPPVRISAAGIAQVLAGGPLPGFSATMIYEQTEFRLGAGERLLCFTDGLDPTGLSAGERLPDWCSRALSESVSLPLDSAMDHVVAAIQKSVGPEPGDDWTVLLLEGASQAASARPERR